MTTFKDEREFQDTILSLVKMLGVKHYHTHRSTKSVKGFVDLVLVGRRGVLWRELKTETGKVGPEQARWVAALLEAGEDAAIWRPEDWPERIARELRALGRSSFPGEAEETVRRRANARYRRGSR